MGKATRQRGRPRAFHDQTDKNRIQALDRAMDVLESLARSGGQTLTEIATELGQSPATVYRVLVTLQARGIAEVDPASQVWYVGSGAFRLGAAFLRRSSVVERARPVMRTLMQETGETANLGIERGDEVLFLSQVETHHSIRAFFPPGTLSPLHASGIGKALLSCASGDRVTRLLRSPQARFTAKTLITPDALHKDIRLTQERGYAFDDEEKTDGMRCVAAPIRNLHGEAIAGISVSGPSHRMTVGRIADMGALVVEAAQSLSEPAVGGDKAV